ncbi:MAG: hypothetical protein QNJ23_04500 [Woeseiaceae bacterium]|nr:hypothetical protein [Woeseiaceae bacterium]
MTFRVFGPRFMLAMLLAAFATFAQEADELEPAVDTSAIEPAVDTSSVADQSIDDIEPAVPTAVLAADVTRDESGSQVMDRLELGRTEITGNQELPKVLYIVPWQKSDPGDLMGRPVNTLLDDVLAPLDREEFMRQVEYHTDLYGEE